MSFLQKFGKNLFGMEWSFDIEMTMGWLCDGWDGKIFWMVDAWFRNGNLAHSDLYGGSDMLETRIFDRWMKGTSQKTQKFGKAHYKI